MTESRLKEYIDINPKVKLQKGEKYSSVEMEKITVGQKVADANNKAEYTGKSCSKFLPNDTLMARITPCLENGKIAKYESDTAGFGSTEFFVLRAKENKVTADYVYYLSQTHYIRQLAVNSMTGASGRQRADAKYIGNIKWNFPDIEIQIKIADILSAYDNLIENNNKRIRLLEQMAENLYKEWFVRFRFPGYEDVEFIDGFPKEWKICRMDQLAKIKAGGDAPADSTKELTDECSIPIYSNGIENEGLYGYTSKAKISKPSITISARGTVGYTCLRRVHYTPIVRLICIIPHEEKLANWLYYYFKRTIVIANGTSQQQITIPMMSREKVLFPTEDLINKFYDYSTAYLDEMDRLKEQNSNLKKQRDMLLPRLMSGKLEV